MNVLSEGRFYVNEGDLKDSAASKLFDYKITGEKTYELCADFLTSNKDKNNNGDYRYGYNNKRWRHNAGYQCLGQKVKADIIIDTVKPK